MTSLQLFDALPAHIEAALTESISRFGVLVPIAKCQHGALLDGHHRSRIAADLDVVCPEIMHLGDDGPECGDVCAEISRTLNSDRRHLTDEQRQEHGIRAAAGALGLPKSTVAREVEELSQMGQLERPDRSVGLDGKGHGRRTAKGRSGTAGLSSTAGLTSRPATATNVAGDQRDLCARPDKPRRCARRR